MSTETTHPERVFNPTKRLEAMMLGRTIPTLSTKVHEGNQLHISVKKERSFDADIFNVLVILQPSGNGLTVRMSLNSKSAQLHHLTHPRHAATVAREWQRQLSPGYSPLRQMLEELETFFTKLARCVAADTAPANRAEDFSKDGKVTHIGLFKTIRNSYEAWTPPA